MPWGRWESGMFIRPAISFIGLKSRMLFISRFTVFYV
jgi:hypothetical protein